MLVLGRFTGESLVLEVKEPCTIKVMLVDILSSHKARLGFDAPQSVRILREELLDAPAVESRATEPA